MKICIYGAGAAGCAVAAKISGVRGAEISLIARGEHYNALKQNGLRLIGKEGESTFKLNVVDESSKLPIQDVIILAAKSYSLPEIAQKIPQISDKNTAIIPAGNGIPWWFLFEHDCQLKNHKFGKLDPEGIIEKNIPFENITGGLFYMAASLVEPGVVANYEGPRFVIGAPSGGLKGAAFLLGEMLTEASFIKPISANIRSDIWLKLCWNIIYNPMGVVTGMTSGEMGNDPKMQELARGVGAEMQRLAEKLNIPLKLDVEKFMIGAASRAGKHKPSMLQDYEAGKKLEIDAIIGSVVEIAQLLKVNIPNISFIFQSIMAKCCQIK